MHKFILMLALGLLTACERQSTRDATSDPTGESKPREELAREWTAEAFGALSGRLMQAISEDGHPAAIQVCSVEADELLDGVADAHGAVIRRVTDRPRNPENQASARDLEVMQLIRGMVGRGEAPEPVVEEHVVWLPIRVAMPVCLTCHGDPESDIAPDTLAAIGEHYPRDLATGYAEGDLRGLWRVEFPSPDTK